MLHLSIELPLGLYPREFVLIPLNLVPHLLNLFILLLNLPLQPLLYFLQLLNSGHMRLIHLCLLFHHL